MKRLIHLCLILLLSPTLKALKLINQSPYAGTVKFEIKLEIDSESENTVYKWINQSKLLTIDDSIFSTYAGTTYSVVIQDLNYTKTRSVCLLHSPRRSGMKITYLGGGKCSVEN